MCAVAGVIGTQDAAISILSEAAEAKPEYLKLQNSIELLAIGAGDPETALKANQNQAQTGENLIRKVGLLFQLGRHSGVVDRAQEVANSDAIMNRNAGLALAMGYASARKLARITAADGLKSALEKHAESGEFLAFAQFAFTSFEQPNSRASLDHLRLGMVTSPDSWFLVANLFTNLDVSDASQAAEAIHLAKVLRRNALLTRAEAVQEIHAMLTLEFWQDASVAAANALARFGDDQRLLSLLAVAEEMRGRTGVAFTVLERAMAAGDDRVSILHNYMGIALRLGRIECVRNALDRLMGIQVSHADRLEFLRLRALLYVQEGEHAQARSLALEVGRIADQTNEDEEGMFLNLFMGVTLNGPQLEDGVDHEFSRRLDTFAETWPESKLFRKVQIPDNGFATLDDLHHLLDPLVGGSRNRMREFEQRERQLKHGELPVPYIMRPGYAIHYIANAFDLWAISMQSDDEAKQLHLQTTLPVAGADRRSPLRDMPLLDLTSLLLLDSLDLFDMLFGLFQRVAISRNTVGFVSQHVNSILAGGPGTASAKSILASINKWIDRIELPGYEGQTGLMLTGAIVVRDYIQLVKSGRWAMYCDDAVLRMMMMHEGLSVVSFATTDLLRFADSEDLISASEVASALAKLVLWNVSINVDNRYLVASLDGALPANARSSAADRLAAFERHASFTVLFRAIANPGKSPSD